LRRRQLLLLLLLLELLCQRLLTVLVRLQGMAPSHSQHPQTPLLSAAVLMVGWVAAQVGKAALVLQAHPQVKVLCVFPHPQVWVYCWVPCGQIAHLVAASALHLQQQAALAVVAMAAVVVQPP
jgi:hypothetical protein